MKIDVIHVTLIRLLDAGELEQDSTAIMFEAPGDCGSSYIDADQERQGSVTRELALQLNAGLRDSRLVLFDMAIFPPSQIARSLTFYAGLEQLVA